MSENKGRLNKSLRLNSLKIYENKPQRKEKLYVHNKKGLNESKIKQVKGQLMVILKNTKQKQRNYSDRIIPDKSKKK